MIWNDAVARIFAPSAITSSHVVMEEFVSNRGQILVYGADWCGDCLRTKTQLTSLGIDFDYLDTSADNSERENAIEISGVPSIPVVVFPDGTHFVEPSNAEVETKLRSLQLIN